MDEILKALLLFNKIGLDMRAWRKISSQNLVPSSLWKDDFNKIKECGITENGLTKLRENERLGWAEKEVDRCQRLNINIITFLDKKYPKTLSILKDAPLILYWKGQLIDFTSRPVGVVGTRRATIYGQRIAERIGIQCAKANVPLISGGAAGIDGFAHNGVCNAGGKTVAIFGNGVNVVFPRSNGNLFDRICEKGALISEFPLDAKGEAWRFPRRNRLVAALSEKLVVVEAPLKSGAMITARLALDLGREVWAVPGHINEQVSEGCNRLIFDGAYPYINDEVFWGIQKQQKLLFGGQTDIHSLRLENLSPEERSVVSFLCRSGGHTIDNIANEVNMGAANVLRIIAILSAKEIVYKSAPGRFSVNA